VRIVVSGAGAAGLPTARLLLAAGAHDLIACDRAGALTLDRAAPLDDYKRQLAAVSNPRGQDGPLGAVLAGADVFIGLSGPGAVTEDEIATMGSDPIVFALANPIPEIPPEALTGVARVVATGRSDYANQINNALAFPGLFRGALDVQATDINQAMMLAAAEALGALIDPDELTEEYIIPSMFDRRVADAVAHATREAARRSGAARRLRGRD
jgi:malate dehydrogenase (oxaloacetate-decarboxylating)